MKLQPKRNVLFLAMMISIAVSVILTGALNVDCLDHDCLTCDVPECPICQRIEMAEIFIKALKLASIALFFTGCFVSFVQITNAFTNHNAYLPSPVALKVRFNS